jgi:ubiquinone/menaquinone biosynthesis C-methylase UbiE
MAEKIGNINLSIFKLQRGARILDVGCGIGNISKRLSAYGYEIIALDREVKLLSSLKDIVNNTKRTFPMYIVAADAKGLPFKDSFFDGIIMAEVLEHIENPKEALSECNRILKTNGMFCLSVPSSYTEKFYGLLHPKYFENAGHINIFKKDSLCDLLKKSRFKVCGIHKENFEPALFWIVHSFLRSKFDFTGVPKENFKATKIFNECFNFLDNAKFIQPFMNIGRKILYKSLYIYCRKTY